MTFPDRSFNRIGVPPPLQLSSLSPGAHALPVAWRWRIAEVTKNGLKSSTERGPLSFSSVSPPWVNCFEMSRYVRFSSDSDQIADVPTRRIKCAPAARETACETQVHPCAEQRPRTSRTRAPVALADPSEPWWDQAGSRTSTSRSFVGMRSSTVVMRTRPSLAPSPDDFGS
jgi:hypothetical protein